MRDRTRDRTRGRRRRGRPNLPGHRRRGPGRPRRASRPYCRWSAPLTRLWSRRPRRRSSRPGIPSTPEGTAHPAIRPPTPTPTRWRHRPGWSVTPCSAGHGCGSSLVTALVSALVGGLVGAGRRRRQPADHRDHVRPQPERAHPSPGRPGGAGQGGAGRGLHRQPVRVGGSAGGDFVQAAGSGMIITPDGEVLTNNHVVAGASSVTVTLFGQTKALSAHVLGTDPTDDLALIQVDHVSGPADGHPWRLVADQGGRFRLGHRQRAWPWPGDRR